MSLLIPIVVGIGTAVAWKIIRPHLPGRCNNCGDKTNLIGNINICYKCNIRFHNSGLA
jgi:hypothetical protein